MRLTFRPRKFPGSERRQVFSDMRILGESNNDAISIGTVVGGFWDFRNDAYNGAWAEADR
jgi:hypothetical protein